MTLPNVSSRPNSRQFILATEAPYCGWERCGEEPTFHHNDDLDIRQMQSIRRNQAGQGSGDWDIQPVLNSLALEIGICERELACSSEWAVSLYFGHQSKHNQQFPIGDTDIICPPAAQMNALDHGLKKISGITNAHPRISEVKILVGHKFLIQVFAGELSLDIVATSWRKYMDSIRGLYQEVDREWTALEHRGDGVKLWLRPRGVDAERLGGAYLDALVATDVHISLSNGF